MSYKKSNAETSTVTRDLRGFDLETGNIYESISIISKRSNQISSELKEELTSKLSEFAINSDNLEEIFENREQIEISKYYERLPKATLIAIKEFEENNIYFKRNNTEGEEQ